MPTSPVSDTEKGLFAERKPLCRRVGLVDFTLGKHQRNVDEVRPGKGTYKKKW